MSASSAAPRRTRRGRVSRVVVHSRARSHPSQDQKAWDEKPEQEHNSTCAARGLSRRRVNGATRAHGERTAIDIQGRRMAAIVLLVKALGGGWRVEQK